jgi:hypothetical protein
VFYTRSDEAGELLNAQTTMEINMSYAAHHKDFRSIAIHKSSPDGVAVAKVSLLRRIFDAILHSRQRDLDRQAARFLAGRAFTDDVEREMTRRLLTSNWSVNVAPYADRRFP